MFCSNCGQYVNSAQRYCPACGGNLAASNASRDFAIPSGVMARAAAHADRHEELEGVWGWLLFFCISITVIAPMAILLFHERRPLPLEILVRLQVIFGVITGTNLWSRGSSALGMLKIFLFSKFLVVCLLLFISPMTGLSTAETVGKLIGSFIAVVMPIVWFLYFQSSLRVRATYGRNL